jgi:hypothetical protein
VLEFARSVWGSAFVLEFIFAFLSVSVEVAVAVGESKTFNPRPKTIQFSSPCERLSSKRPATFLSFK